MIRFFSMLFILILLFSSQLGAQAIIPVSSEIARTIIEAPHGEGFKLIDARSIDMYNSGHIRSAIVIDVNQDNLREKLAPFLMKDTLFLYCTTSNRIQKMKDSLINMGYKKLLYLMTDGITGWKEQGFELEISAPKPKYESEK